MDPTTSPPAAPDPQPLSPEPSPASGLPAASPPRTYRPNLARHRRHFDKYPNPVAWAVPLIALGLGIAAMMNVLPEMSSDPRRFAQGYVKAHRQAVPSMRAVPVTRAVVVADSIAARLALAPSFATRVAAAGAEVIAAKEDDAVSGAQLHLLIRLPAAGSRPLSIFQEKFVARSVDLFRRIDGPGGRLYLHSEPAAKAAPADSVVLWTEPGTLVTVVGAAPEESLIAFGDRMLRTARPPVASLTP